jgi:uncharacterized protein DUF4128
MAADAVYDAIKAHLETAANVAVLADAATGVVPPFRFENEAFTKPDAAPWIAVAMTGVLYGQQSIGAHTQAGNRWDETGHVWLSVFVPTGTGGSRARQMAKMLADIFRGLNTLLSGNLEFMDSFIGEGEPAEDEGNWYMLPLAIEWRRVEA